MEAKFNFKSQICTSKVQSERLLTLGLKKETADMSYQYLNQWDGWFIRPIEEDEKITHMEIPAWSLHRLIDLIPKILPTKSKIELNLLDRSVSYSQNQTTHYLRTEGVLEFTIRNNNLYECLISCISWLIKEGYFNKEWLEE